jgi:hypothetical protein
MDTLRLYILDFCWSDIEPSHILFGAIYDDELINSMEDGVKAVCELLNKGFLELYLNDYGRGYEKLDNISEKDLLAHTKKGKFDEGVVEYPPEFEYFFKTTDKGRELVDDIDIDELMEKNK